MDAESGITIEKNMALYGAYAITEVCSEALDSMPLHTDELPEHVQEAINGAKEALKGAHDGLYFAIQEQQHGGEN